MEVLSVWIGEQYQESSQGLIRNMVGTESDCLGLPQKGCKALYPRSQWRSLGWEMKLRWPQERQSTGVPDVVTENGTMQQMEWHAIRAGSDLLGGLKASPGSDIVWMQLPSWTLLRWQTSCSSVTALADHHGTLA
ncbi:uncharacterized protein LOC143822016 [Paroedura picta]|uniref:uncharacterized protein LOC143822016 n=1 Tax=Paroedura picta TaxID=143630 RepID=UPI004056DC00